jgi:hypothetical protein
LTRASHQRIAKRAAKFDPPAFVPPPPGMLSEQVDLDAYGLTLGLVHPEGYPLMVAVWDGQGLRKLLPEQASLWADELVKAGEAVTLAPVIEALRRLVKRIGEIVSASIMRQMGVAGTA